MADKTEWLARWKEGDDEAFQKIWEVLYPKLVSYAENRMLNMRKRTFDGEDIALSAMHSFYLAKQRNAFPNLNTSDDLFKILYVIVQRKISAQRRNDTADRRNRGHERGESVFLDAAGEQHGGLSEASLQEVTHEEVIEYHEELEKRLEGIDEPLAKEMLALRLEGYENEEIATKMNLSLRTIERKFQLIRKNWLNDLE